MSALGTFHRLNGLFMLGSSGEIGRIVDQKFQFDLDLSRRFADYATRYLNDYAAHADDHRFRVGLIFQSRITKPWGSETLLFTDTVVHTLYPLSGTQQHGLTAFQRKKRENSVYFGMELLLEYALKDSPGVPIFVPILRDRGTMLKEYAKMLGDTLAQEDPMAPVIEVLNFIGPATASRISLDAFLPLKEQLRATVIKPDARKSIEAKIMDSMRTTAGNTTVPQSSTAQLTIAEPSSPASIFPAALPTATPAPASEPTLSKTGAKSPYWYNAALHEPICEKLQKFLGLSYEYPASEEVRYFQRFQSFSVEQQKILAASCPVYSAPAGTVLLEQGTSDQWNLYLLQGDVQMVAADGEKKIVSGAKDSARNALASLKPRKFTVTAMTRVRFMFLHEKIVADIQSQRDSGLRLI